MISDEMKKYVLGLHKAKRENNEIAIREYSRLVSECSKECKLTGFEFSFAFSEAILFADYLYWLVMYAKDAWEGAVDDGWANSELAKELKKNVGRKRGSGMSKLDNLQNKLDMWQRTATLTPSDAAQLHQNFAVLHARIAELETKIDIRKDQLREAKNILIDKNLQIDSLYEEGYKLQQRIAELEADNAEFRQLIRDWSILLEQDDYFQLWHVESVRQAMLEINKECEE